LLPVALPLAPAATVVGRFPAALATVLRRHGISEAFIEAEGEAMADHCLSKTKNRSAIGMMTEFASLAGAYVESEDAVDLVELSLWLARTPCGPLYSRQGSPDRELAAHVARRRPDWRTALPQNGVAGRGSAGRARPVGPTIWGLANDRGGPMVDRVVVLHADDGLSFIADACAVMADAVSETRLVTAGQADLVDAYAEMVLAFSRLVRPRLLGDGETVRVAVMDHLLDRLTEARTGLIALPVLDIIDRLHGELTQDHARV